MRAPPVPQRCRGVRFLGVTLELWGVGQLADRPAVNREVGGSNPPAPVGVARSYGASPSRPLLVIASSVQPLPRPFPRATRCGAPLAPRRRTQNLDNGRLMRRLEAGSPTHSMALAALTKSTCQTHILILTVRSLSVTAVARGAPCA